MISLNFGFILKENHVYIEEKTALKKKFVMVEEELDGIDTDGNLEDLPR